MPPSPTTTVSLEAVKMDVPLLAPFTIATSRLTRVQNVAVRLTLASGAVGWGEIPSLPPVTREDQPSALRELAELAQWLPGADAASWRALSAQLGDRIAGWPAVRAGVEMALLDALARHVGLPLYQWFGGTHDHVVTDITLPICPAAEAETLAAQYRSEGFGTIKTKVGHDWREDVERLAAIRSGHPSCELILDANEGYTAREALELIAALRSQNLLPELFEQPVARDDWEGLSRVTRESGVPVAADESCRSTADAWRIASQGCAHVLNIKLAKCGVVEALAIAELAQASGLGLMIGGMVETRLAMGFAAHFAAGLGGFRYVDLDTPLLLADDPVAGGYRADGPRYDLATGESGHGGSLASTASSE